MSSVEVAGAPFGTPEIVHHWEIEAISRAGVIGCDPYLARDAANSSLSPPPLSTTTLEQEPTMPCGRKRKRRKIATHKRKKRKRLNRHKKKLR